MDITSAKFIKGITGPDAILDDTRAQIAFIGRSNVGKSSLINSLTKKKGLAITSSFPGRTKQINLFLINETFYLVDLPGYGFAKASGVNREQLRNLIEWYLFESDYEQRKIVLMIDGLVGPTKDDLGILADLEDAGKNLIVVVNKIDKIKKSEYKKQMKKIEDLIGPHKIIPCSTVDKIGLKEIIREITMK